MIKETYLRLLDDDKYKRFIDNNKKAYLAHAFMMLEENSPQEWQLGYYLPEKDKMVTFFMGDKIESSEETEIFKKDSKPLGKLDVDKISYKVEDAENKAREIMKEKYPGESPYKTIIIIQVLEEGQVYNITYVTRSFNTINIRLDTISLELKKDEKRSLMELGSKG